MCFLTSRSSSSGEADRCPVETRTWRHTGSAYGAGRGRKGPGGFQEEKALNLSVERGKAEGIRVRVRGQGRMVSSMCEDQRAREWIEHPEPGWS